MTYQETLDWMFAQLPMYQQKGKTALNNKLDKSLLFDQVLNHPHKKFKSIHVAGTNGKGSCSHMMASVLQEAGYKVGLYTSPHLKDFRERIKINGKPATENFVVGFIEEHKAFLEENQLSFFEMTVGMAFYYFAKQNVDIAIIEVGLGGRLDSTNIIRPEIALITNIGLDHTQILGDTLEKIALEKAGIIKKNVPLVIGENQKSIAPIFKLIASQKGCPIYFAEDLVTEHFESDLIGTYQKKNIRSSVATLKKLKGFYITQRDVANGLVKVTTNTGLMGRWQVLNERPKIICDTAHNKEGLSLVLEQLKCQKAGKRHFVIGFVSDKNVDDILQLFPKEAAYYFTAPNIRRALKVATLMQKAQKTGLNGTVFPTVERALEAAKSVAKEEDLIFIGGSTFVVAEAL